MPYIEVIAPGRFETRGEAYPTVDDNPEISRRATITLIRGIKMVRDGISWEDAFQTPYGYDPMLIAAVQQFFLYPPEDFELLIRTALDRQQTYSASGKASASNRRCNQYPYAETPTAPNQRTSTAKTRNRPADAQQHDRKALSSTTPRAKAPESTPMPQLTKPWLGPPRCPRSY